MRETHPIAIAEYTCCECIKKISPGEEYQCINAIEHDKWVTYRTCRDCEAKRKALGYEIAIGDLAFNLMMDFDYEADNRFQMREEYDQTDCMQKMRM